MELLLAATYVAFCCVAFKIFQNSGNKRSLGIAALGGTGGVACADGAPAR